MEWPPTTAFKFQSVTQTKQTMPMHQKMMAYDRVLSHLNNARLAQTAFPLIFQFKAVASETPQGSSSIGQVRYKNSTLTSAPLIPP